MVLREAITHHGREAGIHHGRKAGIHHGREAGVPQGVYWVYLRVCTGYASLCTILWEKCGTERPLRHPFHCWAILTFLTFPLINPVKSPIKPGTESPSAQGWCIPSLYFILRFLTQTGLPTGFKSVSHRFGQERGRNNGEKQ